LRSGPAFVSQCGVAREIGLRIDELGLVAFQISNVLINQGLVGARIDLREQISHMYFLAFGEVDADDLSLDLCANDVGVIRNHRTYTAQIDRNVMLGDDPGDDRHRGCGGRGRRFLQWMGMREVQEAAGHEQGSQ
jgi:hypothetical protein